MTKASIKQREYIEKLAADLDDLEFCEVMEATHRVDSVSVHRGKKPKERTKAQRIANLDSRTASEVINLLKTPEFVQSIKLLSNSSRSR